MTAQQIDIRGLHHAAYRCKDSEKTRAFYEDFLGLPLADAFEISTTMTGRKTRVLHSFYGMGDGSCIAFFEAPDRPFEFKDQHDFDLHIAVEVDMDTLHAMFEKGKSEGMAPRGISDHGFIHSIYFRDPLGQRVELSCYKFEPPVGVTHSQVLFEAHKLRVAEGAYNILDSHLANAIEMLTKRDQRSLSEDREPKHAYPQPVAGP